MKFQGCFLIEIEKNEDERGYFARSWDKEEFQNKGINSSFVQSNISFNKIKGTLRGIHFQEHPFEEGKLVRCTKGKIFEVFIDLRKNSKTYKKWDSVELDSGKNFELYIPEGFALGLQTLENNSEIFYQMTQFYKPNSSKGIRWDDPEFRINWPLEPKLISKKDQNWENFSD
jgi:dTDP-4-dehydrorhamnose 3,5-epimerase